MCAKYALLIGCNEYDDAGIRPLKKCHTNAEHIAALLREPDIGGFPPENVTPLPSPGYEEAATTTARFFAGRRDDDLLVYYFTGHGIRDDRSRQLYLAVRNSSKAHLRWLGLPAVTLRNEIKFTAAKRVIVILDCCYAGAFDDSLSTSTKFEEDFETASADDGGGLGRYVLTAAAAHEEAHEGDGDVPETVFTRWLVEGLKTGAADRNGKGLISVRDLYEYVAERIASAGRLQTPQMWISRQQGEPVILARSARLAGPRRVLQAILEGGKKHCAEADLEARLRDAALDDPAAACRYLLDHKYVNRMSGYIWITDSGRLWLKSLNS